MKVNNKEQLYSFKLTNTVTNKTEKKITKLTMEEALEKNNAFALNRSQLRYVTVK